LPLRAESGILRVRGMTEPLVAVRRIALPAVLAAFAAAGAAVRLDAARRDPDPPSLESEHTSPSGAFTFRTPADWVVENRAAEPETVNAAGSGVRVRFVHRPGEHGYDSLHGACMLERLAPPIETSPVIKYEYDYIGGDVGGDRRALDSAFVIRYDSPIHGHKEWRQRNITVVGGGHSLCAVSYAPAPLWKKSKETRALLDAVLASVTFR
jgi:hypothetical protein